MATAMTNLYDYYDQYYYYDSPSDIIDAAGADTTDLQGSDSPGVLVYQPQSHATPVREAAAAAQAVRRSRRRQRAAGCLTEILWDDVQRARDLLRISRRRRRQEHQLERVAGDGDDASFRASAADSATPALCSLKRHCRSDYPDLSAAPATPRVSSDPAGIPEAPAALGARGIRDLRQILRGLMEKRGATPDDCGAAQQPVAQAVTVSTKSDSLPAVCQYPMSGRASICLPTQYPLELPHACLWSAEEEDNTDPELRQLQSEVAVQAALVEANHRLLRECPGGRLSRQVKRRRTMEFAMSQEKLRSLNMRIAEIRTRGDLILAEAEQAPPQQALPPLDDHKDCATALSKSLFSLPVSEFSAEACPVYGRQMKKSASLTSAASSTASSSNSVSSSAPMSHAVSLDSGFQEANHQVGAVAMMESLLAHDFQLIDQDDDVEISMP